MDNRLLKNLPQGHPGGSRSGSDEDRRPANRCLDGDTIRYAVGNCSLGSVLVAESTMGICALFLGDDPDRLVRHLHQRFPKAEIAGGGNNLQRSVTAAVALVEKPSLGPALPLDIRGTAFQLQVWEALRQIPPGSKESYTEIARRIGRPKAFRAVARACAANPIAVAIPCHRVVRKDGALSGYQWGVARKAELLDRERSGSPAR